MPKTSPITLPPFRDLAKAPAKNKAEPTRPGRRRCTGSALPAAAPAPTAPAAGRAATTAARRRARRRGRAGYSARQSPGQGLGNRRAADPCAGRHRRAVPAARPDRTVGLGQANGGLEALAPGLGAVQGNGIGQQTLELLERGRSLPAVATLEVVALGDVQVQLQALDRVEQLAAAFGRRLQ